MDIILSLLVYAAFAALFLTGIKRAPSLSRDECYKRLNDLRGIMALEIVIGHVVRYENSYLMPFGKFMLIGVGFFFFVSGWGLCKSYYEKPHYLNTFLKTRFVYLAGVAFIALIVIFIIDMLSPVKTDFSSYSLEIKVIIQSIFVRTNWYIRELLLLYLVFYFVYKYIKKYRLEVLLGIVIIIAVGLYGLGYVRCWYASILSFPLGCLFYNNYTRIVTSLKSKLGMLSVWCLGIIGFSSIFFDNDHFLSAFITNNALCICVVALLVLFSNVFDAENPVKKFLNKYATELFLFQFIFLAIAEKAAWNYWYRMIFVIGMDILVSILVHPVMNALKVVCNGKTLKERKYEKTK